MSVADLKTDLIKLVVITEDKAFLKYMIDNFKSYHQGEDWWDNLSDYEREMIEAGLKEIDKGKGIPYEQVRIEINEILHKS